VIYISGEKAAKAVR